MQGAERWGSNKQQQHHRGGPPPAATLLSCARQRCMRTLQDLGPAAPDSSAGCMACVEASLAHFLQDLPCCGATASAVRRHMLLWHCCLDRHWGTAAACSSGCSTAARMSPCEPRAATQQAWLPCMSHHPCYRALQFKKLLATAMARFTKVNPAALDVCIFRRRHSSAQSQSTATQYTTKQFVAAAADVCRP